MSESVCVRKFANKMEAEVAQGVLESCGVKSVVMADDAGGMIPPLAKEARLMVMEEDLQKAREALESASG